MKMAYEQRELSGSVFVNDDKQKETHPDFKGSALIDGKAYWVSGWKKKTGAGKTWLSLAFKAKDGAQSEVPNPKEKPGSVSVSPPIDDDLPF